MRWAWSVIVLLLPAPAGATEMQAGEFVDRWLAASRRPANAPPKAAYAQMTADPEIKRLAGIFSDALNTFRSNLLADRAAGKARACPPKTVDFTTDGVITDLKRLPGDWRQRALSDAVGEAMTGRYPCGAAPTAAPVLTDTSFTIRPSDRARWAWVPYQSVANLILFEAKVNGQPVTVLLDNGASKSILATSLVDRMGLRLGSSGGALMTGRSTAPTRRVETATFEIPGAFTATGPFVAYDMAAISKLAERPIDAVLGAELLEQFTLVILPDKQRFGIAKGADLTTASNAKVSLPLADGRTVAATINGQPMMLGVDLGFTGGIQLNDVAWRRAFPQGNAGELTGSNVTAEGISRPKRTAPAKLAIGAITARGFPIDDGFGLNNADGLLGNGFLRNFSMIMDMPGRQLTLIPRAKPKAPAAP